MNELEDIRCQQAEVLMGRRRIGDAAMPVRAEVRQRILPKQGQRLDLGNAGDGERPARIGPAPAARRRPALRMR